MWNLLFAVPMYSVPFLCSNAVVPPAFIEPQ
jgi:hypothetical protein